MAYVSQKPWIFSGTLRENIEFIHGKNSQRLKEAIKYSCLSQDLKLLSKGLDTEIG